MALVNLKIVQHKFLNWKNHTVNLINIYNEIKPGVILLNSHGNASNEEIKIYNYVTYQSNKLEDRNNGCAIAVRLGIKHRIRGGRTIGMRTIGMRTIGMEDNWHAENWHGGQLALTFLIVSYLITLMF